MEYLLELNLTQMEVKMFFVTLILSICVFIRTIGYAIFEYKNNNNKIATIIIIVLAFIALIGPCIVTLK